MSSTSDFVIGAQYYRPPNPPRRDWQRDLKRMAELGMNTVKFWACWSWMNPREGEVDFADLDQLMDLAHDAELRVVINVILEDAPYWLEQRAPEARYRDQEDRPIHLGAAMNTPGGGWPGLCFHNEPVATAGLAFLDAVVKRYASHPALMAWDVWNEPHLEPASYFPDRIYCYCRKSIGLFRSWMKQRYGTLDAVNDRWARRFSDWEQVAPPRLFEAVPDMLDWREFWFDSLRSWLDGRVATARNADGGHPVTTHVALSGFTGQMATHTLDEWTLAGAVDVFGTSSFPTWLMNDDHVEHLMNLDTARDAAAGKPYWQTELQGGRGRRAGTASTGHPRPAIVTMEMWNAIAAGARGILFWQWRPELLGPESPGYGLCAVDGGLTDRARAAGTFAAMVQHVPELAETRPVPSSVGLIVSRRTAVHAFATDRTMDIYRRSVMGAYRMLLDADLEPVFVHEDQIERGEVPTSLRAMYHPMPAVIGDGAVKNLSRWVAEGGRLVSEGAPGEYDARGCHRHQLPPGELRDAFGVRAVEVDAITGALPFTLDGFPASGGWIRDVFELDGASPAGHFADGTVAASRNTYGDGEAVLIATCPSVTYETNTSAATRAAVTRLLGDRGRSLLRWGTPKPGLMLRRHMLPDGRPAVFALNWTDVPALLRAEGPTRVHGLSRSVDAKVGDSFTLEALQGVFAVAHRQP